VVERFRLQTLERTPMQRMETPEGIANAARFLTSDDSRFIKGIELFAAGGNAQV
jgi:NAD(P)-dependent dehydrogenase (short-subunit alcohol dehydrogenase family)